MTGSKAFQLHLPPAVVEEWKDIVDIMAELIGVPAGLIMKLDEPDIEVCVASKTGKNPYRCGQREACWGSGLYCETVLATRDRLLVPNALKSERWKTNPDVKINMISYLGYPILMPNGKPFGTICVLDCKENAYTPTYEHLVVRLRDLVQSHIELLFINQFLGDENKRLTDYLKEIQALRGRVQFCSCCKRIKDDKGAWKPLEHYLYGHPKAEFSRTFCPDCGRRTELGGGLDKSH